MLRYISGFFNFLETSRFRARFPSTVRLESKDITHKGVNKELDGKLDSTMQLVTRRKISMPSTASTHTVLVIRTHFNENFDRKDLHLFIRYRHI